MILKSISLLHNKLERSIFSANWSFKLSLFAKIGSVANRVSEEKKGEYLCVSEMKIRHFIVIFSPETECKPVWVFPISLFATDPKTGCQPVVF
jgi:hypothetical protein